MLELTIEPVNLYNEELGEFFTVRGQTLKLEHSLVSVAKWESRWEKPFLSKTPMTFPQTVDYIRHMTITQNVDPFIFRQLANQHLDVIFEYMEAPMTATTFNEKKQPWSSNREVVTAEIIYYWMVEFQIPFECQRWHLNRLLTLINVVNLKRAPKKKMSKAEINKRNYDLNAARRKLLGTTG